MPIIIAEKVRWYPFPLNKPVFCRPQNQMIPPNQNERRAKPAQMPEPVRRIQISITGLFSDGI